jgi:predicted dehydrogenase
VSPPLRIAVVGAGLIGRRHAEMIDREPGCTLGAIVEPDARAAAAAVAETGAPILQDVTELDDGSLNAVVIATPNDTHGKVAMACAKRGLAILLEKPIAHTPEVAQEIIDICAEREVPLLIGHHRRYHNSVAEAKRLLEEGAIGDLAAISAMWAARKPDDYFHEDWRKQPGGGPVMINLIHDVDLLRHICGEIVSVSALTSSKSRQLNVEDTAAISIRLASGALCSAVISDATLTPWSWEAATGENPDVARTGEPVYRFMGTKGSLEFPNMRIWRSVGGVDGDWSTLLETEDLDHRTTIPLKAQLAHFLQVARGEAEPMISGADALKTLTATQAVLRAALTGEQVDIL